MIVMKVLILEIRLDLNKYQLFQLQQVHVGLLTLLSVRIGPNSPADKDYEGGFNALMYKDLSQ